MQNKERSCAKQLVVNVLQLVVCLPIALQEVVPNTNCKTVGVLPEVLVSKSKYKRSLDPLNENLTPKGNKLNEFLSIESQMVIAPKKGVPVDQDLAGLSNNAETKFLHKQIEQSTLCLSQQNQLIFN